MHWHRLVPIFWLLLVSGASGTTAQIADRRVLGDCDAFASKLAEYEGFVQEQMKEKQIPGLVVGFFKDGCTWVAAFGFADLENRVPVSVDSAFRYASVQKSMTAAAVLQREEPGRIVVDAAVPSYER